MDLVEWQGIEGRDVLCSKSDILPVDSIHMCTFAGNLSAFLNG